MQVLPGKKVWMEVHFPIFRVSTTLGIPSLDITRSLLYRCNVNYHFKLPLLRGPLCLVPDLFSLSHIRNSKTTFF